MSTFEYIPGVINPSTYAGESIIKVMNGGSTQIPANAFFSAGTARITSGSVSLTFESNSIITFINTEAFKNCSGLTNVTLPASLTGIGLQVFKDCGLTTLTIDPSGSGSILNSGSIDSQVFSGNDTMTVNLNKDTASNINITVPSQSTSFYGAVNVTTVNYPNTFYYTPGTTSPSAYNNESTIKVMNGGQTQIPQYAFSSGGVGTIISGSVSLTFESSSTITFINTEAFTGCSGLTNVTLPASLTGIGLQVFKDCDLTTLTIEPSGSGSILNTGSIDSQVFSGNDTMTVNLNKATASNIGITVPSQSTSFYGSTTAKTLNYPNTFNYKADATPASDYNGENTILIVNWTNSSGDVAIPANAFEGLISPSGPHPPVGSVSLVFENASQPASNTVLINDKAFNNCPSLTSVTFPTSLTTISPVAFALPSSPGDPSQGLSNVTFTDIANSLLTTINSQVFQNQYSLTSITLPKSLSSIGGEAFGSCGLTTLTIEPSDTTGSSLTSSSIDSLAFRYNDGMTVNLNKATASNIGITVPSQSTSFFGSTTTTTLNYPNTFNYKADATPASDYNGENTILIVNWTNPSGDVAIPANAFEGLISPSGPHPPVGSVSLVFENASQPNSNTVLINDKAFNNCPSLTSVTFPTSLTTISSVAFALPSSPTAGQGLSNVTFTDIANSALITIYNQIFENQSNLISITLPKSLQTIGALAFKDTGLKTLTIEPSGGASSLTSIASDAFSDVPDKMTVNMNKATANNQSGFTDFPSPNTFFFGALHAIVLNYPDIFFHIDGVTEPLDYNGESSLVVNNSSNNKVTEGSYNGKAPSSYPPISLGFEYPSTTTTIEELAFANTPSLKQATIPDSVKSIAPNAFSSSGLQFVTMSQKNGLGFNVQPGKQVPFYGATVVISLPAGEILEISTDIIFPYPKNEKNKRLLGVNQKISSGLARPNFKFQTNQFSAGRSRTAQSKQKANGPVTVIFPIR